MTIIATTANAHSKSPLYCMRRNAGLKSLAVMATGGGNHRPAQ
ncbi:unnamed protein product [Mycetohabitans rhizoxinica HKI 454]|uniref:Uncharacterized protein n=1 Tax=Mycetohabitans rhizoxinica (strain DSM 19002 / CIP 109453 / HKI 454) TaxID=882378 RepID=E5ATE7_MYCRK|nr:unnamed protein product [Mycetohabitans rhizoxinica HKI 454]